jgi:hypothetical protein
MRRKNSNTGHALRKAGFRRGAFGPKQRKRYYLVCGDFYAPARCQLSKHIGHGKRVAMFTTI